MLHALVVNINSYHLHRNMWFQK